MSRQDLLSQIKGILSRTFGDRLRGVVLYGSEARGVSGPDSDIDLLVLLAPPVCRLADLWACVRALYPLVLELERPIHAKPVDVNDYEAQNCPLYCDARREGVLA